MKILTLENTTYKLEKISNLEVVPMDYAYFGYVVEDAQGMEKKVVHYKNAKKSIYVEDSPSYLNEVFG